MVGLDIGFQGMFGWLNRGFVFKIKEKLEQQMVMIGLEHEG